MSYSFSVTAANKAEAKAKIAAEFDGVVTSQPVHAADREQAVAAAGAFVDVLNDPKDGEVICVSVSGSLGWNGTDTKEFNGAGFNVSASVRKQ